MAVAKSYQNMEQLGEPFKNGSNWYVKINYRYANGKCAEKVVKWYYNNPASSSFQFNERNAFGFKDAGFITIYKGNQDRITKFFKEIAPRQAWYNTVFLWHTYSDMPNVENLPDDIEPIRIEWDSVKLDDTKMRNKDELTKEIARLIYVR